MKEARWGLMVHYLADWKARELREPMTVEKWNDLVDHFDVSGLADPTRIKMGCDPITDALFFVF